MSTSVRPGSPMPVSMPVIESRIIEGDRTAFIPLLLEGDEDIAMLSRYLNDGTLLSLVCDGQLAALALVVDNELMNIVVEASCRRMGLGSRLLREVEAFVAQGHDCIVLGTGDVSPARAFYLANGYTECGVRKDFFKAYDHPVIECGRVLTDMVMYRKNLR